MRYKIKSLNIGKFGIIKNKSVELSDFNVFFGKNESGKTTILDAILTSLFKYPEKLFVNRSYKHREIKIELDNGKEIIEITPEESTFIDNLGLFDNISQKDYMIFRSLVMRGLSYSLEGENHTNKVFDLIKKNISGFDYNKLRNKIFDLVQITPKTQDFKKDRKENIKNLKASLSNIESIKEKLIQLSNEQRKKPELENRLFLSKQLKETIDKLILYNQNNKYNIQKKKVSTLEKSLQSYSFIQEEDLFKWERLIKSDYDVDKELAKAKNEIKMLSFKSNDLMESIKNSSVEIKKLSDELAKYEKLKENKTLYDSLIEKLNKDSLIFKISAAVTIISILISVIFGVKHIYLPLIPTILLFGYSTFLFFKNKSTTNRMIELLELAEKSGVSFTFFEDKISKINNLLNDLKTKLESLNKEHDSVNENLHKNENIVKDTERNIKEIKEEQVKLISATHCKSIEELRNKLKEKQKLTINLKNEKNILEQMEKPKNNSIDLSQIKNRINLMNVDEQYESLKETILKYINSIENAKDIPELNKINTELVSLGGIVTKEINDNESAITEINKLEDGIKLLLNANKYNNRFEMELKEIEIKNTLKLYEDARTAAKIAIDAINETEKKFTEDIGNTINLPKIQKYMRLITGKNNLTVKINGKMEFTIIEDEGEINEAYLSTGTLVQLMFCIRIAIADKIFNNQKLFFFLDDTLLTFDEIRKANAIKLIKELADQGWQFFYFTVDKSVIELFKKEIKNLKEIIL